MEYAKTIIKADIDFINSPHREKSRIIAGEWGRRGNSSVTYCDRSRSEFIKAILAHLHVLLESKSFSRLCQGRIFPVRAIYFSARSPERETKGSVPVKVMITKRHETRTNTRSSNQFRAARLCSFLQTIRERPDRDAQNPQSDRIDIKRKEMRVHCTIRG